jgi:hypothetical protein
MSAPRGKVYVLRGSLPVWLALVVALPLGAVLLTSLLLASLIAVAGAGIAALVLPRIRRSRPSGGDDAIELDSSQYRRLDQRRRRPGEGE